MRRFNRVFLYLVFPGLVLFWGIGWLLYWIGIRKIDKTKKFSTPNNLKIFVLNPEQEQLVKETFSESLEA